jgi:lambda family phage minor tail protein L
MGIDSEAIATDVQYLAPGNMVELFELDATDIGADSVFYFTENTDSGGSVFFNSIEYLPLDFEIEGLELSSSGQMPEPTVKLSNVNNTIGTAVNSLEDMVGAILTRRRTFEKYLDGRPAEDPTAQFPVDIFVIDQKTAHNKQYVEFKLVPFLDYTGVRIPRRQVLRDSCSYLYRTYDTDTLTFDYTNVDECPYTGSNYFDSDGESCSAEDDNCGKRLSDCTKRFPGNSTHIPFGGFPNVAKIRIR